MRFSFKKLLLIVTASLLTATAAWGGGSIYRWFNPYLDVDLAGRTVITSDWLEILPRSPLKVKRQRYLLSLALDSSASLDRSAALTLTDSKVPAPQVELISSDGYTYSLKPSGFLLPHTGNVVAYFSADDLPRDKSFVKVRIRSGAAFTCSKIFWRNYNIWDAEA